MSEMFDIDCVIFQVIVDDVVMVFLGVLVGFFDLIEGEGGIMLVLNDFIIEFGIGLFI